MCSITAFEGFLEFNRSEYTHFCVGFAYVSLLAKSSVLTELISIADD